MGLVSTYRLQLHREFSFEDLSRIIPYLQKLGIGTLYASPIFASVPGSNHGYDGLDPHRVNPEIGTEEQLADISLKLKEQNIGWLQDIVPNHMAFDPRNPWLLDVLEKGPQSPYADYFDLSWSGDFYQGRLMVPFLGASVEETIEKGELKIVYRNSRLGFEYYDTVYPLQPLSYAELIRGVKDLPQALSTLLDQLPKTEDRKMYAESWHEFLMQLEGLMHDWNIHQFMEKRLEQVNNDHALLKKIESMQSYRLCYWKETDSEINYRRFFTVNGLICLNIQDVKVFNGYHQLIHSCIEKGIFTGLRIDHIDGLFDPHKYLTRLRSLGGGDLPIVVEKIVEPGESLPANWPVQGTTGYEFLSLVNNLLTNVQAGSAFTRFYTQLTREHKPVEQLIHEKKAHILYRHMKGELENLYRYFRDLNIIEKKAFAAIRPEELKEAIGEFLIHCPVYRFYGNRFPLDAAEESAVHTVLQEVRNNNQEISHAVNLLEKLLLQVPHQANEETNARIAAFYMRCMQFSGPLMAKGVEDTLMYTYHRFIAHNEVGDAPGTFGLGIEAFHQAMQQRQQQWPASLNATSTHDTKRGEDVRARLNVLSDIPEKWLEQVRQWQEMNTPLKKGAGPDANDEYFIYQVITGAHPMPGEEDNFQERIEAYLEKSLREAKLHSNWDRPDEDYEKATKDFALAILQDKEGFQKSFQTFLAHIADHGIINSLTQLIIKFTCPGIPDVYQGCELWDLSLVDPDNRRPVDFEKRISWLSEDAVDLEALWQERYQGRIKLWLTRLLFQLRQQHENLFAEGNYLPLPTGGKFKDHIIAFARQYRHKVFVVILPLHTASLTANTGNDPLQIDWEDTYVSLPGDLNEDWDVLITDKKISSKGMIRVGEVFSPFPFALLKGESEISERGAGILLHISSLPASFGIGDLGPVAKAFADFLGRSSQQYWQLLPINPTDAGQGHSPYSSLSSRAGNTLFISPELLAAEGLLTEQELLDAIKQPSGRVNFEEAGKLKQELFDKAWKAYGDGKAGHLRSDLDKFREQEKEWLQDFVLYDFLKQEQGGKPWYQWEDDLKLRDTTALEKIKDSHKEELEKRTWLQFLFSKQWHQLRDYCNSLGIRLIGDLPFYVSYDSADVWSHRHLFALDEQGNPVGLAGVPPDDFSADGQLWGMPVFNWEAMKQEGYAWWINRLKKNIELFDLVRLDHFRAFSAYWEVPGNESTAKNGSWKQGPGAAFFEAVQKELQELPFVAEDLGEIDAPVYELRDAFKLPGMKVLQFAFGNDMARSVHIPHHHERNFIVYTGTHDNNTTRGWFTTEASEEARLNLERYVGRPVSSAEVSLVLARMAYGSVARVAILPMQDVLNLDEKARMNTPASQSENWAWGLLPGQADGIAAENLKKWAEIYDRKL